MLSNTLEPDILQKKNSAQEIRPGCKVCELRYRPIGTLFFIQEYILLFPLPKKNVIFNIHHLLFQNQYFFLVNSSNLMGIIKIIIVLIELQLNSTVNSWQACLDYAEKQKHDINST